MIYKEVNHKRRMTRVDKEEKTAVTCPTCGKELKTWGVHYFNCCGARHSVSENLTEEIEEEPEEEILSEEDLEEGETLVKCSKCGSFLITTEEKQFEHCGIKQNVKLCLADFKDFNGGEDEKMETPEGEGEGEIKSDPSERTKSEATPATTRTILSNGKGAHKKAKDKEVEKTSKTGEEEEELDEGEEDLTCSDTPDKEVEIWVCLGCDEVFTDNGYSDAVCPVCGEEYARPATEEEIGAV